MIFVSWGVGWEDKEGLIDIYIERDGRSSIWPKCNSLQLKGETCDLGFRPGIRFHLIFCLCVSFFYLYRKSDFSKKKKKKNGSHYYQCVSHWMYCTNFTNFLCQLLSQLVLYWFEQYFKSNGQHLFWLTSNYSWFCLLKLN